MTGEERTGPPVGNVHFKSPGPAGVASLIKKKLMRRIVRTKQFKDS